MNKERLQLLAELLKEYESFAEPHYNTIYNKYGVEYSLWKDYDEWWTSPKHTVSYLHDQVLRIAETISTDASGR